MDTVLCKELIVSTIARRGKGVKHDPVRIITQVFEKDGNLIAEHDPTPGTFVAWDLIRFAQWAKKDGWDFERLNPDTVDKWLDSIETRVIPDADGGL